MKFSDKYELLESLTTGTVETFAANDKVRGERVLVHILDCPPQKPGQSAIEWVLEAFRRVAPEPAGPVLEAGKYGETKYVYLVTKPADEAAQKGWVRRYEIQGQDTQETMSHPKAVAPSAPPVAPPPHMEPARAPVSVTQLLRDFESQNKPAPKVPTPIARPLPNLSVGSNPSGLHSAPPWEPVRPQAPLPPKEAPRMADPSNSFAPDSKDKGFPDAGFPAPPAASGLKDTTKPGEFTSFFQGPFRGDAPSEVPSFSSQPIEPPQKKVGEFTAIFGSVGGQPEQQAPTLEESGNIPAPSSFTGIFKDMESAPRSPSPQPSGVAPRPMEPLPASPRPGQIPPLPVSVVPPPPVISATPVVLPTPPMPSMPVARPSSLPGDGATGAFSRPGANEPVPVMPAAPVGPSPYTQIISRDKLMAPTDAAEEEAAAPASAGKFAAPAMPKAPAMTPPKPQVKMPPPPKITAPPPPKAPKMPALNAPAPPPVSILPVIITLTGLFVVAVALILYFVLKH